jgi:hypothetical protein
VKRLHISLRLNPLPVIAIALVSMAHAGDERRIASFFRPIDGSILRREIAQNVARARLYGIVHDCGALRATFWAWFDKNSRQMESSLLPFLYRHTL